MHRYLVTHRQRIAATRGMMGALAKLRRKNQKRREEKEAKKLASVMSRELAVLGDTAGATA